MGSFDVYVMRDDVIRFRSSPQFSALLWRPSKHLVLGVMSMLQGVSATFY